MSLFGRIAGLEEGKQISPHQFTAVAAEFGKNAITGPQAIAAFTPGLTTAETTEANAILNNVKTGVYGRDRVTDVWYMVELRIAPYDVEANVKARLAY